MSRRRYSTPHSSNIALTPSSVAGTPHILYENMAREKGNNV
jgi:hypothetical protein